MEIRLCLIWGIWQRILLHMENKTKIGVCRQWSGFNHEFGHRIINPLWLWRVYVANPSTNIWYYFIPLFFQFLFDLHYTHWSNFSTFYKLMCFRDFKLLGGHFCFREKTDNLFLYVPFSHYLIVVWWKGKLFSPVLVY